MSVLEVEDLHAHIYTQKGVVKAVDGISLKVNAGETLGLVGESGCGKSMTCLSIMRLLPRPNGQIVGGRIMLDDHDLVQMNEQQFRGIRGRLISMIPQDPYTSMNPCFTIGNQLMEPLRTHLGLRKSGLIERAKQLLDLVRIPEAISRLKNFPHELSGGMRQRVVGAIAVSCHPKLILADEPTTSLDVTIQAQYLYLIKQIQAEFGMAMIYVTHDLGIISKVCDRVAVMYAGKIIETAGIAEIFQQPAHPYTQALFSSIPPIDHDVDWLPSIEGQPPELINLPTGCRFFDRCRFAMERCQGKYPPEFQVGKKHFTSCWKYVL